MPRPASIALIAVGHGHGQGFKRLYGFPFLEAGPSVPQDTEVGGMPLRGVPARFSAIPYRQAHGLIVIFQDLVIPLHRVDGPQFHMLAFTLDGDAHLGTRIASGNVGGSPSHLTHRR